MSKAEILFESQLKALKICGFVTQYRLFAEIVGAGKGLRKRLNENGFKDYRFDFAWPMSKVAVEINGSIWRKGGHNTGAGLIRDYDKLNMAQMQGWNVFVFTTEQVRNGEAVASIEKVFENIIRSK